MPGGRGVPAEGGGTESTYEIHTSSVHKRYTHLQEHEDCFNLINHNKLRLYIYIYNVFCALILSHTVA